MDHIYRSQRSWGKVMFSQACVILFTGGVCWYTTTTPSLGSGHPPGTDTPPEQTPCLSLPQSMLGHTVNARAVRVLLECNLVVHSMGPLICTDTSSDIAIILTLS